MFLADRHPVQKNFLGFLVNYGVEDLSAIYFPWVLLQQEW